MIGEVIRTQHNYGLWATNRIFDATEQLDAAHLSVPGHAGHGSIHDTLRHMMEVYLRWYSWFDGSLPPDEARRLTIDPASVPDLAALRQRWNEITSRTSMFVKNVSGDVLAQPMLVETPWMPSKQVPLWQLMLHVANHETKHRSEVAAMLTEHGSSPGYLDLMFYILDPANNSGL